MTDVTVRARAGRATRAGLTTLTARSEPVEPPSDLLDHLGADGFAWIDGDAGFVTHGVAAVVAPEHAVELLASVDHSVHAALPDHVAVRAVGALPFAGRGDLVVPAVLVASDGRGRAWRTVVGHAEDAGAPAPAPAPSPVPTPATAPTTFTVTPSSLRPEWDAGVQVALADIEAGRIEKVVLAREVAVHADANFDRRVVLEALRSTQPGCTVFADGGFVGASPELLVRRRGRAVESRPLAGTAAGPEGLLHSEKQANEHALVVDAVVAALRAHAVEVAVAGPEVLQLATVAHLATHVRADLREPAPSAVDLAAALHPTPAVAGTPTAAALDAIRRLERFDRGRYAGPCGWVDARGDGEFVVALRSGELDGSAARCFAGAGIVAGSEPGAEWAETQAKLDPMLRALVRP